MMGPQELNDLVDFSTLHRVSTQHQRKTLSKLVYAQAAASESRDPSTQVGAVAVSMDLAVLATGFNGFPRRVPDRPEWYRDRNLKYPLIVHAEANLVAQAARTGASLLNSTVLVTMPPCHVCAGLLIQAGVISVYMPDPLTHPRFPDWGASLRLALGMFRSAGVSAFIYDTTGG